MNTFENVKQHLHENIMIEEEKKIMGIDSISESLEVLFAMRNAESGQCCASGTCS